MDRNTVLPQKGAPRRIKLNSGNLWNESDFAVLRNTGRTVASRAPIFRGFRAEKACRFLLHFLNRPEFIII